jgi:hypothetical protein
MLLHPYPSCQLKAWLATFLAARSVTTALNTPQTAWPRGDLVIARIVSQFMPAALRPAYTVAITVRQHR